MKNIPDMNEQIKIRFQKVKELEKIEKVVYKERFEKEGLISNILEKKEKEKVKTAGRIIAIREFGKLIFGHIQDMSGKVQFALELNTTGKEKFQFFKKYVDIADFLGIEGEIFITKTGEKTILIKDFTLLTKTLRPLPEKWHGIKDTETKYRQRYLDLIMNRSTMERFLKRSKLIKLIRNYLDKHGFVEVETPILQTKKSGALAKPFITYHNALDMDLFLRIAPETYLKRCIAGGFEKVYEFAKSFRNEGIDPSHLQEFTMLEFYVSYWNYKDLMEFTEKMIKDIVYKLLGTYKFKYQGQEINLEGKWPVYSFRELILNNCGIDINDYPDKESLKKAIINNGIILEDMDKLGRGNLIDALYKKVARPKMIQPQFLIHHPIDLSPLARKNDNNPEITDRFQLVINGWEIINAYSELVDPIDQRYRFEQQAKAHSSGDEEALEMDDDYLLCMEHGMPPIAGWGMGIDRFFALISDVDNLKDVVLFPLMKPLKEKGGEMSDFTKFPDLSNFNYTIEKAFTLLNKHIKTDNLYKHSLASAAVMKGLARYFNQDEDKWFIIGLLHDLDFEKTKNTPEQHGLVSADILKEEGFPDSVIDAIKSHNEMTGTIRKNGLDICLTAGETITGLIVATVLVYPDKKISSVKVSSIKKRMKKKDFARNVKRENILLIEKTGLNLDKFIEISLNSMCKISDKLGL